MSDQEDSCSDIPDLEETKKPIKKKTLIPGIITFRSKEGNLYDFHCHDLITNSDYFKTILESTDENPIEIDEEDKYLEKLFWYFKNPLLEFDSITEIVDMWKLGNKWLIEDIIADSFDEYIKIFDK